jgi:hypothetical protein
MEHGRTREQYSLKRPGANVEVMNVPLEVQVKFEKQLQDSDVSNAASGLPVHDSVSSREHICGNAPSSAEAESQKAP